MKFTDAENLKRMLGGQRPDEGETPVEWDEELRKKHRRDGTVVEEAAVRLPEHKVGFVFDAESGRLKRVYTW